jgi:SMI1 / KNR4 family (SUKH-1)
LTALGHWIQPTPITGLVERNERIETVSSQSMTKEQEQNYEDFLEILKSHKHLGTKIFPDGSIAIAHVPHVAPVAYFHRLFAPLSIAEIETLQDELEYDFPPALVMFYNLHNGLGIYSDDLNIYGQRRNWQRTDMEAAVQQPYSIQDSNNYNWPKMASDDSLVIGSIGPDKSPITIDRLGNVFLWPNTDSPSPSRSYPDFFAFLLGEAQKLALMFNENGKAVDTQYH